MNVGNGREQHDDTAGQTRIDWKAVIAGLALTWTALFGAANVLRNNILDSVDARIAEHEAANAESRRAFFSELEQRSAGSLGRISQLEINCARFQDWRSYVDREQDSVREWRGSTSQRLEQFSSWIKTDDRRMDAIERSIDTLKDRIHSGKPHP